MTTAIFPGKFDPVTMGHLDIIQRASRLFDRVVVAVFESPDRELLFTTEERVALVREAISDTQGVEVDSFRGLVVDYAHSRGAQVMVRGLRLNTDFEYEFEMALMNRKLAADIDVVCLITSLEYQYVRSSRLKEVAKLGGTYPAWRRPTWSKPYEPDLAPMPDGSRTDERSCRYGDA